MQFVYHHINDSRLSQAYNLIDSGEIMLLSVDIFDTLLWRKLPFAEDLFLLLGKQLKEDGWLIPAVTAEIFTQLRIAAEKNARAEKEFLQGNREVTLAEIYWNLRKIFVQLTTEQMLMPAPVGIYESDVSSLIQKETLLEKSLIVWDQKILDLICYAGKKGIQTILVSDTYFEQKELSILFKDRKEILEPHLKEVFLSSEYSCSKQDGLFHQVLQKLKIPSDKILHIGDHKKSDVLSAQRVGIKSLYYEKFSSRLKELVTREWGEDFYQRKELLNEHQGDFGITSLRAKISYHADILKYKKEEQFFWHYGATVLGPILFGFIHWVYSRCYEMQQKSVFCLMREGRLYARLIEKFAPYFPQHQIEAKELWVSRLFITHTSLAYGFQNELTAMLNAFLEEFTVETVSAYLGLDSRSMGRWAQYSNMMLEESSLREEFVLYLIKNKEHRLRIIEVAAAKRSRFLKYLAQIVDISLVQKMVLVDVGWNGSAQQAMQKILQLADSKTELHGLYVGTTETTGIHLLNGILKEGFLFKGGYPPCGNAHKKGCYVLEQTATAETGLGSLKDIDEDGKIITSPFLIPLKQKKEAQIVQEGIFAFFELAGSYMQAGYLKWDAHSEKLQSQLREIFLRSMLNVTQEEAHRFGTWFHEHGPAANLIQVIGKNRYYENYIKDMLPTAAFKESGLNWPAAYAAKNCKYLTLMSQAMWMQTLPPECFLSQDAYSLRIFLDTGKDFPQKAHRNLFLRSNPNRHFYALTNVYSSKKPILRLQFLLSFPSAIIRIKSLRITAFERNNPEPHTLIFFEENQPHSLTCIADQQMDFNTFYCTNHLQLLHSFAEKEIYQLKIKLCCEKFNMSN